MRNLMIFGLVLLLLALNSWASTTVQLSGSSGEAILSSVENNTNNVTGNINNTLSADINATNRSAGDLWSWGTIPAGYTLDKSGKLVRNTTDNQWLPGI